MTGRRHVWLLLAIALLTAGSILCYRFLPLTAIGLGIGSGVLAAVVAVHIAAVVALVAPFAVLRRRSRHQKP